MCHYYLFLPLKYPYLLSFFEVWKVFVFLTILFSLSCFMSFVHGWNSSHYWFILVIWQTILLIAHSSSWYRKQCRTIIETRKRWLFDIFLDIYIRYKNLSSRCWWWWKYSIIIVFIIIISMCKVVLCNRKETSQQQLHECFNLLWSIKKAARHCWNQLQDIVGVQPSRNHFYLLLL